MAPDSPQPSRSAVWAIARRQHDRITVSQLTALGMSPDAIRHRVRKGLLHPERRGVLAVSRPRGTNEEEWMTAVLVCGPQGTLSGEGAFAHWGLGEWSGGPVEISVPAGVSRSPAGIVVRRRSGIFPAERRVRDFIPVTSPALTVIDNARRLGEEGTEAAISELSNRRVATPVRIRAAAERFSRLPGSGLVRRVLDRHSFQITDSELERRVRRLLREHDLPQPLTQQWLNGYRVDFYWPDLGLVLEADSLTYHRTAAQQLTDIERDGTHTAAGLTTVRCTRWEVVHQPAKVIARLQPVIARLSAIHHSA